jgi:hypothetical protein
MKLVCMLLNVWKVPRGVLIDKMSCTVRMDS